MSLQELKTNVDSLNNEVNSLKGKTELLTSQINDLEIKLEDVLFDRELFKKSIEVLNVVQESTQIQIKEKFESLVTFALQSIMGEGYSFEIKFTKRGNLQEVDFNIKTPNLKESFDPKNTESGFILDVVALALRIVLLEIYEPKIEGALILDEPFKNISEEYLEKSSEFLKAIHQKIKRQIIIVSHKQELVRNADNSISLK